MNAVGKIVQNLNAKKLQGISLSDKEQSELRQSTAEFQKYQKAVLGADASIGRYQRNVGNYTGALKGAVGAARSLASAMGLLGGAFLVVRVFSDAFKRVREFDKEMQNMAGILRTTRPELKQIEERIIAVAASSIKTSNEVAQLASSLFVLGKTKNEVLQLLEPVNNLSIALGATSEETGEFLVQTLNAFGKGAESAGDFADTIAAIRTSTSLDFQKMRDSFQYITPISRILGKDLAYTGAVVGVLADNGIKAESAGRLLATAQIKLATSGITLQEALDELNNAYKEGKTGTELLEIAGTSFGKQAAKIGIILATQQDRLDTYDEKIRKAGGSLEDLTNEQLKSLDAQLKITTSVWEEFILSIENGKGVISSALGSFLLSIQSSLKGLTLLNKSQEERNKYFNEQHHQETLKAVAKAYKDAGENAKDFATAEADTARDRVDAIKKEIEALKEKNKELKDGGLEKGARSTLSILTLGVVSTETFDVQKNKKTIEDLNRELAYQTAVLQESEKVIGFVDESQKDLNDTNEDGIAINTKTIASLRALIKAERENIEGIDLEVEGNDQVIKAKSKLIDKYQAEIDALLGTNKARKAVMEAVKGSLSYLEQEVSKLKEKKSKLASTSQEYFNHEKAIRKAEQAVKDFKDETNLLLVALVGVGKIKSIGSFEESVKKIQDITSKLNIKNGVKVIEGLDMGGLDSLDDWSENFRKQQELIYNIQKEYADKRLELERELSNNIVDLGHSVADALFQAELERLDKQYAVNEEKANRALEFANGNAAAEIQVKDQLAEKQTAIEEKRIETENRAFLLNQAFKAAEISINTIKSVAALKAQAAILLANPVTAPLASLALGQIPLVIATGAAAGAAVLAQSIPAFEHGGTTPGGEVLVNDAKRSNFKEVIKTPDGSILRPQKRNTVMDLPKGSHVFSSEQEFMKDLKRLTDLNNIMFDSNLFNAPDLMPNINVENNSATAQDFDKVLTKHFSNLQTNVLNIDGSGFTKKIIKGNSATILHNNRTSFKGFSV